MKRNWLWIPVFTLALVGCSDDAEDLDDGTGGGGGSASTGPDIEELYACEETDFAVLMPFTGPGIAEDGSFNELTEASYIVHSTQLFVRPEAEDEVFALSGDVIAAIMETPGFVALSLSGSDGCGSVRTLGVWESEEAMYTLVAGEAHAKAMSRTGAVSFTGKVTHWTATPDEVHVLDWDVANGKIASTEPSFRYD